MITEPLAAPGVNATDNDAFPEAIEMPVGAPGTASVVIGFEAADTNDVPALFVAVTVNV